MSASICWEPNPKKVNALPVSAPQHFIRVLEHRDWKDGLSLDQTEPPALRALAELQPYSSEDRNPFTVLINAIEKHGSVRVWVTY